MRSSAATSPKRTSCRRSPKRRSCADAGPRRQPKRKRRPQGAARDCRRPDLGPVLRRQLHFSLARTTWLPEETFTSNVPVALTAFGGLLNETVTFAPEGDTVAVPVAPDSGLTALV